MYVVGRADHDRIHIFPFKHLAEIAVFLRLWKFLSGLLKVMLVYVAERDDVLALNTIDISGGAICSPDAPDVQLFVGRLFAPFCIGAAMSVFEPSGGEDSTEGRILQKISARQRLCCFHVYFPRTLWRQTYF